MVLLHVINQRIVDGLMRHAMLDKDIMQWRLKAEEIAQESLMETGKQLEDMGFDVKCTVKTGFPWDVILDVEKKGRPFHHSYWVTWAVQYR